MPTAFGPDERVLDVAFNDDALTVSLRDGRVISVPLVWYPRLSNATPRPAPELENCQRRVHPLARPRKKF